MKHSSLVAALGLSASLLSAVAAFAQTGDTNTPPSSTPPASVPASDQANQQATAATATADAKLAVIWERARATSEKDKKDTEAKLDVTKSSVDREAAAKGDSVVAERLATEFGMTADALTAEKTHYNTGWGDLMIAHALQANAKTDITLDQVFQMRTSDGLSWGQIAHGFDLRLGDVVSGVKREGAVATGHAKGDGKVATMRGVSPTHTSTHAHGSAGTGAAAEAGDSGMHGPSGK